MGIDCSTCSTCFIDRLIKPRDAMALHKVASGSSRALLPCCRAAGRAAVRRGLATAAASSSATGSSSTSTPTTYKAPLKKGKSAIYDEAVAYIQKDSEEKLKQLKELEARKSSSEADEGLDQEILGLQIASEINLPQTRWQFKNGQGDMSKPVFRYLAEQSWRREGRLGILMQRVLQMNVVPDLLGEIDPDADLRVLLNDADVEVGSFLEPSKTVEAPQMRVQVYHPEERLYTLLMVDPDAPNPEQQTYQTECHWALTNIPISAKTSTISAASGNEILSYVPPHPQKGTPYHRYTFLLLEQTSRLSQASLETPGKFDTRAFVSEHGMRPVAVHFFRQVWDKSVSAIYKDDLKTPEPVYGRPKKVDRLERDDIVESVVGDRHAVL